MRNVTVTMDDEVARWTRRAAADREQSVSRFVGEVLRDRMRDDDAYETAMTEFLAVRPTGGNRRRRYPSRAEVHDRAALRR